MKYLQPIPENIPAELRDLAQWVVWKDDGQGNKWPADAKRL